MNLSFHYEKTATFVFADGTFFLDKRDAHDFNDRATRLKKLCAVHVAWALSSTRRTVLDASATSAGAIWRCCRLCHGM